MATVGVRALKNGLTRYLRRTKLGEPIVVTERGRPIAVLGPIRTGDRGETLDERLARLATHGYLTMPRSRPIERLTRTRLKGATLSSAVLDQRR